MEHTPLLRRVDLAGNGIVVLGPAHAERHGAAVQGVSVAGGGDGVQPGLVGLAASGIVSRGDDAQALPLDIVHPLREAEDDVLDVARRVRRDDALGREHSCLDGLAGLGEVEGQDARTVVKVLEPVLRVEEGGARGHRLDLGAGGRGRIGQVRAAPGNVVGPRADPLLQRSGALQLPLQLGIEQLQRAHGKGGVRPASGRLDPLHL